MPACAGMTELRRLFVVHIIPSHAFSMEDTKSTKFGKIIFRNLRVLRTTIRDNLRGLRKLSGRRDASDSDIPRAKAAKVAK
jgi:hypothetical protein